MLAVLSTGGCGILSSEEVVRSRRVKVAERAGGNEGGPQRRDKANPAYRK